MRLIDADKVSHKIKSHLSSVIFRGVEFTPTTKAITNHYEFLRGYEEGAKYIASIVLHSDNLVDAVPVKHGRWEDLREAYNDVPRSKCSLCGCKIIGLESRYNYCPNCGAKMDLEGKE